MFRILISPPFTELYIFLGRYSICLRASPFLNPTLICTQRLRKHTFVWENSFVCYLITCSKQHAPKSVCYVTSGNSFHFHFLSFYFVFEYSRGIIKCIYHYNRLFSITLFFSLAHNTERIASTCSKRPRTTQNALLLSPRQIPFLYEWMCVCVFALHQKA